MKPKPKELESPFGWSAGLEYEKERKRRKTAGFAKRKGLASLAVVVAAAAYFVFSDEKKVVANVERSSTDVAIVSAAVLAPAGSYEASKQLFDYAKMSAHEVASEIRKNDVQIPFSRQAGVREDLALLLSNAGDGAKLYMAMLLEPHIYKVGSVFGKLKPSKSFFGLGGRKAGEPAGNFYYGISIDDFLKTCIRLPDGNDDSLRKSCEIVYFQTQFPEISASNLGNQD